MADITYQRCGELLRTLFEILINETEGLQARDALARLVASVNLTPYESGNYPSGGRRFEKIVRFATVDTIKAGWLVKSKGRWSITEEGKAAYRKYTEPEQFYREAKSLYKLWQEGQVSESEEPEDGRDRVSSVTFEEAEEQSWSEIENYLSAMPPYDFQELVGALLRAMGYYVSWIAPPGKDGGVDIIAWTDPLATRHPRIKVQVKRQVQSISVDPIRSFMALLGENDVGLFVSLGGFTKDAENEVRAQERRRLTLIDLEKLIDLWIQHYNKLDERDRQRLPLQPIWFLAPKS